jgi:phage tail-like protein
MGKPRNFHLTENFILEVDGIERVRFSSVTGLDQQFNDVVIRQGAETTPNRQPGEYQPVDITVEGPAYTDTAFEDLFNKTVDIVNGGGSVGEDLYFDADLKQMDRDKSTVLKKWRLERCYCASYNPGDFDAEAEAPRKESMILRPKKVVPITV